MAELNKIKAEKARDEAEKEAGRREEEEQIRMENILSDRRLFIAPKASAEGACI